MSTGQLPFLRRTICPHCRTAFAPEDVLWIATHSDLLGDPRLGPKEQQRFLPTRFNIDGNALDAKGFACQELACPTCHRAILRSLLESEPEKPCSPPSSQSAVRMDAERSVRDYQFLVDEMGSALRLGDQAPSEKIKSLAQADAEACQEVNERLRRCGELLKQGLRSEAIHLEQSEPGLLDQVAVLDFPQRSEWEAVLRAHGLPVSPALQFETAADLNRAYAEVMPLEGLLKEHRLLALARAPLPVRLQTMKRIARQDSNNPIWAEDIRGFEGVRFGQLEAEAKQATAREDEARLQALIEELRLAAWNQEPPLALIRNAEAGLERVRQKKFRAYLEEVCAKLQDAFAAKDLQRAKKLRKLWDEGTAQAGLAREDSLRERAAPALGWLAREERREAQERQRQAALQEFEGLITASPNRAALEHHLEAFRQHGYEIPTALMERYQKRLERFLKSERRRRIYVGGAVLVGVLLIASVLFFGIYKLSQARKAADAAAQLDEWIENGQLVQAKEYLDELSAKDAQLVNRPEIVDLRQQLANEVERRFLLQQALQRAAEESVDEPESPVLAKAEELARHRGEKDRVQAIRQARKDRIWNLQQQRDEAFLPWFRDLQEKVNRLEGMVQESSDSAAVDPLLTTIDKEMARLPTESKGISEQKRQWTQELTARFQGLRNSIDLHKQESQLVEQLSLSLHRRQSVADYVEAVKTYVKAFPETGRGKDLARVLSELPHWEAVAAWHQLIEPWTSKPFEVKPDEAGERAARCNQFLSQHPLYVDAELVREYASCLAAISQQQESATGSAAAKLRELFAGLLVKDLWVVKLENGKTYYLKANIQREVQKAKELGTGKGYVNVRYLADSEGKEKSTIIKADDVETTSRAPQSVVADLVQKMPANFTAKTWEEATLAIAQKIRSNREMDPVLQVNLLKRVLNLAALGSYSLGQALAEHQRQLKEASVDLEVSWIDPNNTAAGGVRGDARHILERLPSLEPLLKAAQAHRAKVEEAVKRSDRSPIGWLARERSRWSCRSAFQLSGTQELCVLVPGAGGTADWCAVGKSIKGTTTVEVVKLEAFVEGRLVFARRIKAP
jgi:hypothetical protein